MKVNRNYRFVLTVLDNSMIESGEITVLDNELCGERMFQSECHYYAEKNIIESIKAAEKVGEAELSSYYGHTYLIYKETKPRTEKTVEEKDGKKITIEYEVPGEAMLIETITVDENGINIR